MVLGVVERNPEWVGTPMLVERVPEAQAGCSKPTGEQWRGHQTGPPGSPGCKQQQTEFLVPPEDTGDPEVPVDPGGPQGQGTEREPGIHVQEQHVWVS